MKGIPILFSLFLLAVPSWASYSRFRVEFTYKGQVLVATFFSKSPTLCPTYYDDFHFTAVGDFLEPYRFENYTRHKKNHEEREKFRQGFFAWEPVRAHDELLVLHRPTGRPSPGDALGLEGDILGMIAVDRLDRSESLLLERRLVPLNLRIPRPAEYTWSGRYIPRGVFPHWDPELARTYFRPENIVLGDVLQVNALFAHESTWPLLHTLASQYGLFSTGRILLSGEQLTLNGIQYTGPKVFVPTEFVWEVFNKFERGRIKKGALTQYYEMTQARPLVIDGYNQWRDPRLGNETLVQILRKDRVQFGPRWTEHFAKNEGFSFVRDAVVLETRLENSANRNDYRLVRQPERPVLDECVDELVRSQAHPVVQFQLPLTVSISLGNTPPQVFTFALRSASQ